MRFIRDQLLKARNAMVLIVGIIARISGCASQKEISLEDQTEHLKMFLAEIYDGPVEFVIIATKGKGECLTRVELTEIEERLRKREFDLVLMEDLGRLIRGAEVVRLLGVAVDHGTRVIVPGDNVDTANPTWEADATQAAADHVGHQQHTSRRLKSRLKVRFLRNGLATSQPISGYIIREGVTSYDDWLKDDAATAWIREGFYYLKGTLNYTATADYLNGKEIPVGPACSVSIEWNSALVRNFYSNPLLKGVARRNDKVSIKFFGTGKRQSVKNAEGPIYYDCPHLAHLDPLEFDELQDMLARKNAGFGRKPIAGHDPRFRTPRKRTRFPGQHAICWYCGHHMYWGGNGIINNLMCSNSRDCHCWNTIGFNGKLATQRVVEALTAFLWKLPQFESQYRELLERVANEQPAEIANRWRKLEADEQAWLGHKSNVNEAAMKHGMAMLDEAFEKLNIEKSRIDRERKYLEGVKDGDLKVACSLQELRIGLLEQLTNATFECPKFGQFLCKLCPEFHVFNVRRCDDKGHILPRARIRLSLSGMLDIGMVVPELDELLSAVTTYDLFERPQTERIMEDVARLAAAGMSTKEIVNQIPERPTTTAVHKALKLYNRMSELGLTSPYVVLKIPPTNYAKLRRHKNSKYKFKPKNGYTPPALP